MGNNIPGNRLSRRKWISVTGASVGGITLIGNNAIADAGKKEDNGNVDLWEMDSGILISTTKDSGLNSDWIQYVQKEVIQRFAKSEHPGVVNTAHGDLVATSQGEVGGTNSANVLVGYYMGWVDGAPFERKFKVHSFVSKEDRVEIISKAKKEIERGNRQFVNAGEDVSSALDDGPVDADPGWGDPVGTLFDEATVMTEGKDGDIVTLGRFNLFTRMWEADKVDGKNQFGCSLGCLQIPGEELDPSNPGNINPGGYNRKTTVKQNMIGDTNIVNYNPLNDTDGGLWGGVDLESITFGADASGPYGEVTITPTDTVVDEIEDNTQTGGVEYVETEYNFGSFWYPWSHGGDERHEHGNSAVFLYEAYPGNHNINSCTIDAKFDDYQENAVETESLEETFTFGNVDG